MTESIFTTFAPGRRWRFLGDLCGEIFTTEIGGRDAFIHLPQITFDTLGFPFLAKPIAVLELENAKPSEYDSFEQGELISFSAPFGDVRSVEISRLYIEIRSEISDFTPDQYHFWRREYLDRWGELFSSWLDVLTGQVSDAAVRDIRAPAYVDPGFISSSQALGAGTFLDCSVPTNAPIYGNYATLAQLKTVLLKAELAIALPEEHRHLRIARQAFVACDYRKSVAHASIAAEEVVSLLLKRFCKACAGGKVCALKHKKGTLGHKVKKITHENAHLLFGLEDSGLLETRNESTHDTDDVSEIKAQEFLETVSRVVWFNSPLE